MVSLILSFVLALLATLFLVRYSHLHARFTGDHDLSGIQKFHVTPVPRVGGIGILIGLLAGLIFSKTSPIHWGLMLIASSIPCFAAGLFEDIKKCASVTVRMLAIAVSASIAAWWMGAVIPRVDLPFFDPLLSQWPWLAFGMTVFAVTGVTNAFNIIDGYNGLAGMVGAIILGGIVYVAYQVGDRFIFVAAASMLGAVLGFFVWNYPRGLIFLGDGGAYLLGFWIAELSVLLVARNPGISPWFPFLLCFYPVFEAIFTIYRRFFVKKVRIGLPDAAHLHQIIYKRIVRWAVGSSHDKDRLARNYLTAPYLWVLTSFTAITAILFWHFPWVLQLFSLLFAVGYVIIYRRIVMFKVPQWVTLNREKSQ